jgi:hypothetical protein
MHCMVAVLFLPLTFQRGMPRLAGPLMLHFSVSACKERGRHLKLLSLVSNPNHVSSLYSDEQVANQTAKVWKAATSKADPRKQQDWILECLQGGRTRPLAACGVATLCCSSRNMT